MAMATTTTKRNLFAAFVIAVSLAIAQETIEIHAFNYSPSAVSPVAARIVSSTKTTPQQQSRSRSQSSRAGPNHLTELRGNRGGGNSNNDQERRGFFSTVRRFFGASAAVAVGGGGGATNARRPLPAYAAAGDDATESGNIIEIQVRNLEGSSGGDGETPTTGTIKIRMKPEWAPRGVARFEELVSSGFYDGCRFYRVLPGFIAQCGISGDPQTMGKWRSSSIPDDVVKASNERGTVVFATAGPNTRTTQIFVNTRQQGNAFLDEQGFSPFGVVVSGMDVVDRLYSRYGEGAPNGSGPNQGLLQAKGNPYLNDKYPNLSYISKAAVTTAATSTVVASAK